MTTWPPTTFQMDESFRWRLGPFHLWVRRTAEEWQTGIERSEESESSAPVWAEAAPPPEETTWTRWAARADDTRFHLTPALPEAPLVVRPEIPFMFPGGSDVTFFVSLPVWFRLAVGAEGKTPLCEEPSEILSNTFFGEPTHGELGYALKTTARRRPEELRREPHLAACPVRLRNRSASVVAFEHFCIHTRHLSLWGGRERLWSSPVEIVFKGEAEAALMNYPDRTPPEAGAAERVAAARAPAPKGRLQKHLSMVKSLMSM